MDNKERETFTSIISNLTEVIKAQQHTINELLNQNKNELKLSESVKSKKGYFLTEEQQLQMISILENCVIYKDGLIGKQGVDLLYDYKEDIMWGLADNLGIDLDSYYIDPVNLKPVEYVKSKGNKTEE